MINWNNFSLGMYVDDGVLFACTNTICEDWLRSVRLTTEPEKTSSRNPESATRFSPQRASSYPIAANSYYVVQPHPRIHQRLRLAHPRELHDITGHWSST